MNYLTGNKQAIIKYFWLIAPLFCLAYFYHKDMFFGSPLELRIWLERFGSLAPLAYIILYTLRPILFIPALLLNLISAVLFGPALGIIYMLLGGLGSATLCYYLGKHSNFAFINGLAAKWWAFVATYTPDDPFKKMLCLRLVPIFPYDPISFLAGLSNISFPTYALTTLIGMIPGAIAYNFLVDNFLSNNSIFSGMVGIALAFGVPYLYWQQKIRSRG